MDLFDYMREQQKETESPLASRLRPTTLDEMVGQQHIIGKDKLLYRQSRRISLARSFCMARRERVRPHWQRLLQIRPVQSFCRSTRRLPARRTWKMSLPRRRTIRGCTARRRSCLSMRYTVLTRGSRIICYRLWRMARWCSSERRQRILTLR